MKNNYVGFAKAGNTFGPAIGKGEFTQTLPAGHYSLAYTHYDDEIYATNFKPKLDEILNIKSKEFNDAVNVMAKFLSPTTAIDFASNGFLLKRSFMFYGPPGTGKSVLATKLADLAVEAKSALVLYPSDHSSLERTLEVLDETDSSRFKVIVLEEFDSLIAGEDNEWTTLLDGQFQSANQIVIATTNNVHKIPRRLLRPGRFSSLIEIPALTNESRATFLALKNVPKPLILEIVEKTNGYTIDDLKEVVQCSVLLGENLDVVISNINKAKKLGLGASEE